MAIIKKGHKKYLTSRQRKQRRLRRDIIGTDQCPRMSVFRSGKYIYVQAISDESGATLVGASSKESAVMSRIGDVKSEDCPNDARSAKSVAAARAVGLVAAERLKEKGLEKVVFDRNGYVYKGRVQAVAEGLREGGAKV